MISVDALYQKVSDTLAKDQAGNFSNDEFNRILSLVQVDSMNFFLEQDGTKQSVYDALVPFLVRYEVSLASIVPYPENYRSKRNARVGIFVSSGDTSSMKFFPANCLETDEDFDSLYSPIRKPSVATEVYSYSLDSAGIRIYPENISGIFQMSYIRQPNGAIRAVTNDVANEIEVYNPIGTIDLEWQPQQLNMFHDLVCFYMGIDIRESEVIAWLSQRKLKEQ